MFILHFVLACHSIPLTSSSYSVDSAQAPQVRGAVAMYTNAPRNRNKIIPGVRRVPHNPLDHIEGRGDGNSTTKRATVGHHAAAMRGRVKAMHHDRPPPGSPKAVFNGKRAVSVHRQNNYPSESQSQHEEIVKYLTDTWNRVAHEQDSRHSKDNKAWSRVTHDVDNRHQRIIKASLSTWYREKSPNPQVENFKPFDLDKWCGQRTLEKPRGTT